MGKRLCPICGEPNKNIITKIKLNLPTEFRLQNEYNIVSCKNCGFCFADVNSSEEDYNNYYTNFNQYTYYEDNKSVMSEIYKVINRIMSTHLNKNSTILNIGIGNGNFERYISDLGYKNIYAIDPSKESVNNAKQYGISAKVGSIYDEISNDYKNKFDAVFLQSTLEHLLNPMSAIKKITEYLNDDGIFIISVPDLGNIHNNTTKIPNNFNHEHINYFSRVSLNNLMIKNKLVENDFFSGVYNYGKQQINLLIGVYRKMDNCNMEMYKDNITSESIKYYLKTQNNKDSINIINKLVKSQDEVIVWGAGAYTANLMSNSNLKKCNIACYVDNNKSKENMIFEGKKVKLPHKDILKNKKVLICSMLYSDEIKSQIKRMEISCDIYVL